MIELNFSQLNEKDVAREFWCQFANARAGQKQAAADQNHDAAVYYGAALGAYVDVLGLALPAELKPDGSETNKP